MHRRGGDVGQHGVTLVFIEATIYLSGPSLKH